MGRRNKSKNLVPPTKSDPSSSPKNERSVKVEGGMSKGGLVSREKRKIPTEPTTTSPSEEKSIPIKIERTPENSNVESTIEKGKEGGKEGEATVTPAASPEGEKSIPIKVENKGEKSGGGAKELKKLLTEEKIELPGVHNAEKTQAPSKKISKSESPQLGTLYLKVKKANNLDSKDAVGKSDPYVIINYGETKLVSAAKSSTNDPEWDFEVDFKVHENHPETIQVEVMDKDRVGADDSLGSLTINTNSIFAETSEKSVVAKLTGSKEGELEYSIKFSPSEAAVLKPHTVETSHVFNIPGAGGSIKEMQVSHSIQLPEGFQVESIDSTQTETHSFVKTEMTEEAGVHEVITLDKDSQESKIQRDIVIDSLTDTSSQPKPAEKKTSLVIPFMKKETKEATLAECREKDKEHTDDGTSGGEVFDWRDDKDGATGLKEKLQGGESKGETNREDEDQDDECGTNDVLHIRVHKARNLENKDIIGKSDPFIKIRLGCDEVRSKTINNNLDPEWQFHTKYNIDETSPTRVEIEVLDDDMGKDESLGQVNLDISHIRKRGQILNHWLPLAGCKSGEIQVSTQYVKSGTKDTFGLEEDKHIDETEAKVSRTEAKQPPKEWQEETPTGKLFIKVKKARNLAKKRLGNPDPYVTLRRKGKIERSETVKNDQNPVWDFSVEYPTFESADVTIIEVFDKDVGRDDFLGKLELLDEDIIKYKTVTNKWIPLQKCKTGEIQISAQYVDLAENPEALSDLKRLEEEQEALEEKERLEKEREALCRFVPADILQGLPAEFAELLQSEVGKAREKLLTEEPTPKEEEKKEETREEITEVPTPSTDLNEILSMVDGLDEGSSKYIYEQLQIIFIEIEEEERDIGEGARGTVQIR